MGWEFSSRILSVKALTLKTAAPMFAPLHLTTETTDPYAPLVSTLADPSVRLVQQPAGYFYAERQGAYHLILASGGPRLAGLCSLTEANRQ